MRRDGTKVNTHTHTHTHTQYIYIYIYIYIHVPGVPHFLQVRQTCSPWFPQSGYLEWSSCDVGLQGVGERVSEGTG